MALLAKTGRLSRAISIDRHHLTAEVFFDYGNRVRGGPCAGTMGACQMSTRAPCEILLHRVHPLSGNVGEAIDYSDKS